MHFSGKEAFDALSAKGVTHLFHADTVTTACSFLLAKGLASRGYVQSHELAQTSQASDFQDKEFGIWNDVFTDGVDIHGRGGRARGANVYGPVLFRVPLSVILKLGAESSVMVTKTNPIYWRTGQSPAERYFQTLAELALDPALGGYRRENFQHHIVVRTPLGLLPFDSTPVSVALDDPRRTLDGRDLFAEARAKLELAARTSGLAMTVERYACPPDCKCATQYAISSNLVTLF